MSIFDGLPDIFSESLGEPVTYTPVGGGAVTINAFIEDTAIVSSFENADQSGNRVIAHVRTEDVPAAQEGDLLVWLLRSFRVVEPISNDGRGMTTMTLEKAEE